MVKLHFNKSGNEDGPTFLLVHAMGGDHRHWHRLLPYLEDDAQIYGIDLRGHGQSLEFDEHGNAMSYAEDIANFVKEHDLKDFHLVGHSMGGTICILAVIHFGLPIASLTLLAPAAIGIRANQDSIRRFLEITTEDPIDKLHFAIKPFFSPNFLIPDDFTIYVYEQRKNPKIVKHLQCLNEQVASKNLQKLLPINMLSEIEQDVLVIWGIDDQIFPYSHVGNLPPRVKIKLIENAGHSPQLELPYAVANELRCIASLDALNQWSEYSLHDSFIR